MIPGGIHHPTSHIPCVHTQEQQWEDTIGLTVSVVPPVEVNTDKECEEMNRSKSDPQSEGELVLCDKEEVKGLLSPTNQGSSHLLRHGLSSGLEEQEKHNHMHY